MPDPTEEQALEAAPAPAETDAPTPAVAAPADTASQPELTEEQLQDLSPDDALAYLQGKSIEIPDKPKVEAKPETEEAEVTEVETTPAAEAKEEPAAAEKILPNRIPTSQFDTDEQKALNLMHILNEGKKPGDLGRIGLKEAIEQLEQMEGKGKAAEPPAPTPAPAEALSAKVSETETELKTLRAQRAKAIEDGESVTEIEAQIETTRDALSDAKMEAKLAQREAERQQAQEAAAEVQTRQQTRSEVEAEVLKEFSSIRDPETPMGKAWKESLAALKKVDSALLYEPEAPEHIKNASLRSLAKADGITFAQAALKYATPQAEVAAPVATAPAPKPAAPAAKKALPAGGSQATQPAKGQPTVQEVYDAVKDDGDGESAWEAIYGNKPLNLLRP